MKIASDNGCTWLFASDFATISICSNRREWANRRSLVNLMWLVCVYRQLWSASEKDENERKKRVNKSKARASACTLSFVYMFFLYFMCKQLHFEHVYDCRPTAATDCAIRAQIFPSSSASTSTSVCNTWLLSSSFAEYSWNLQSVYVEWLLAGSSSASSIVFTHTHWLLFYIEHSSTSSHCLPNGIVIRRFTQINRRTNTTRMIKIVMAMAPALLTRFIPAHIVCSQVRTHASPKHSYCAEHCICNWLAYVV